MHLKSFTGIVGLILCLLLPHTTLAASSTKTALAQAQRAIELTKFETARAHLQPLTTTSLADQAFFYLGLTYLANLDFDNPNISLKEAEECFMKGIKARKNNPLNYVGLGIIELQKGNKAEAENYFKRAKQIRDSDVVNLYIGKGYAYSKNYSTEQALAYLQTAVKKNKKLAEAYLTMGDAYLRAKDPSSAITYYKKAEEVAPSYLDSYLRQSLIYKYARNYQAALAPIKYVISKNAYYLPAYRMLAELYLASKQVDKALEIYQNQYLPKTDHSCQDRVLYAKFLFEAQKYQESEAVLNRALNECKPSLAAYRLLAYAAYENKDYDLAQKAITHLFEEASPEELTSKDYIYQYKISRWFKKFDEAEKYKALALEQNNSPEVIRAFAVDAFNAQNYEEVLRLYKSMDALDLNLQDYYYLGFAAYLTQDYNQAEEYFKKVLDEQPNYVTLWAYLGYIQAHKESAKFQGLAKPYFDKVIALGSKEPAKYKEELVNAYLYLAQYELEINKSAEGVRSCMNKILQLDPNNKKATHAIKMLDKQAKRK